MAPVVSLCDVGKRYRRRDPERPNSLKGLLARGLRGRAKSTGFWPFRSLSLDVAPGESLGVIGPNGAGKTSLLRVIGGILPATEGHVSVRGRLGALIDLGAGYSGDLTGRENAVFNGIVAGLTRRRVEDQMHDIVAFAGLSKAIDEPLRTYSAGMKLRLAFSVAVHAEPDVLLVDEVLAVGDVGFQKQCIERIEQLRSRGCAVVLVSHDPELIQRHCGRALWLRPDERPVLGPAEVVTSEFVASFSRETARRSPETASVRTLPGGTTLELGVNRMGSLEGEVTEVRLNRNVLEHVVIRTGGALTVDVSYAQRVPVESFVCTVTVLRERIKLFAARCVCAAQGELELRGTGTLRLQLPRLDLVAGSYEIEVGLYPADFRYAYDYHWNAYRLRVEGEADEGYFQVPASWSTVAAAGEQSTE